MCCVIKASRTRLTVTRFSRNADDYAAYRSSKHVKLPKDLRYHLSVLSIKSSMAVFTVMRRDMPFLSAFCHRIITRTRTVFCSTNDLRP